MVTNYSLASFDICKSTPTNLIDSVTFDIQGDSTYITSWATMVVGISANEPVDTIIFPIIDSLNTAYIDGITYTTTLISSTPGAGVTDIDGNSYGTTVLGNGQEWMTENLRTSRYANGDWLESATNSSEPFANSQVGTWCHFEYDFGYDQTYGKLYNWYAVDDVRNVCPDGWHVPDTADFFNLFRYISPENCSNYGFPHPSEYGSWMHIQNAQALIQENSWWDGEPPLIAHNATNATGFSGFDSGWGNSGGWGHGYTWIWSSTAQPGPGVGKLRLSYDYGSGLPSHFFGHESPVGSGYIRCIKD